MYKLEQCDKEYGMSVYRKWHPAPQWIYDAVESYSGDFVGPVWLDGIGLYGEFLFSVRPNGYNWNVNIKATIDPVNAISLEFALGAVRRFQVKLTHAVRKDDFTINLLLRECSKV